MVWGTDSIQKLRSRHIKRLSIATNFVLNIARQVNENSPLWPTVKPRKLANECRPSIISRENKLLLFHKVLPSFSMSLLKTQILYHTLTNLLKRSYVKCSYYNNNKRAIKPQKVEHEGTSHMEES